MRCCKHDRWPDNTFESHTNAAVLLCSAKLVIAFEFVQAEVAKLLYTIPADRIIYPDNIREWCSGDLDLSAYQAASTVRTTKIDQLNYFIFVLLRIR